MPSSLPRNFLGATKSQGSQEVPVTEIELDHGVYAGVHLRMIGVDMIPVQEEHDARLERGISLENWGSMDLWEKALIVANRRVRVAISNIHTEAEIRDAERQAKRRSR